MGAGEYVSYYIKMIFLWRAYKVPSPCKPGTLGETVLSSFSSSFRPSPSGSPQECET